MDPWYWAGSIAITIVFGFLFGRKIDKSYEFAKWLGIGIRGFWLFWTFALSSIFSIYVFYGIFAVYPGLLIVITFHLNHRRMRRSRTNEALVADLDQLGNEVLEKHVKTIVEDPIDLLNTDQEHRKKLFNTLKSADQTVVIVSGWAVSYSHNKDFRSLLAKCLKRGVMVYIGYGYQENKSKRIEKNIEQETRDKMDDLVEWCADRDWEGRLEVFFYPGTSYALIMDDKFAIIGDYNWLSESESTNLNERSWIISSKEFVIQERDKIVMGR